METMKKETMQARARQLRREMTPQERHLWYDFLADYPVRFRRQKVIGDYIVDFYCHQARLVIELDGSQHFNPEEAAYDRRRSEVLEGLEIQVVRYANNQVNEAFREVCEDVDRRVRQILGLAE